MARANRATSHTLFPLNDFVYEIMMETGEKEKEKKTRKGKTEQKQDARMCVCRSLCLCVMCYSIFDPYYLYVFIRPPVIKNYMPTRVRVKTRQSGETV